MWDSGLQDYMDDWWNLMDFIMNSLYLATISLKIVAYVQVLYILQCNVFEIKYIKIFLSTQYIKDQPSMGLQILLHFYLILKKGILTHLLSLLQSNSLHLRGK